MQSFDIDESRHDIGMAQYFGPMAIQFYIVTPNFMLSFDTPTCLI